jgi:NAD(P)-dependent dehydrogenase (short-subunit alcohol dehydrogenase family)
MRVLIIGAHGALGKIITAELAKNHEVVAAGRTSGDFQVDIASAGSIEDMFRAVGPVDACIAAAGDSETRELSELTEEDLEIGIKNKLLGAINLVLIGQKYLNDNGSFTLTSGKMGDKPIKGSSGKAFINGAINSFVTAAALDLGRGLRLNAVSPAKLGKVSSEDVAAAYVKSVESEANGEIFRVY